jgi:hypothetical protein
LITSWSSGGPEGHPVPDTRVRVLPSPACRTRPNRIRTAIRARERRAPFTIRTAVVTTSKNVFYVRRTRSSPFLRCPSLSHSSLGPAQTSGTASGARAARRRSGHGGRGKRGRSWTHPYSTATEVTGEAGNNRSSHTSDSRRGARKRLQAKRKRAPPGGRAAPARTVRPWGGRPAPSLS